MELPQLFTPDNAEQWSATLDANANALKLQTTAWEQGSPTRTVLAVVANVCMLEDVAISLLNQGGFLDYAATGTVVYTDPVTGLEVTAYVTPDPSIPAQNPTGALGALDALADSVYNVQRTLAQFAGGALAILNTSASTYGPFLGGAYHVAQPGAPGSPSYSNTATITITPSTTAGGTITGVVGAAGLIKVTTSGAHGLATGATVMISGVVGVPPLSGPTAWIVSVTSATQFTLDGSAFAGSYTSGGLVYLPTVVTMIADVAGSGSSAAAGNLVTTAVTSLIGVSVANIAPWVGTDIQSNVGLAATCRLKLQSISPNGPRGAYEFFALASQRLAPLLTPPMAVGATITRARARRDPLTGTVTTTIATSAGAPTSDDVTATGAVIQAYCVPDAVTAITQGAVDHAASAAVTIYLPAGYGATATATAQIAIQVYFRTLPIGGISDPGGATNVVPLQGMLAAVASALTASRIPYQDLSGLLAGSATNVQLLLVPVPEVATLSGLPSVTTITS